MLHTVTYGKYYFQEMTVEGQRWVWDVAFSADSQYMFTGKLLFLYIAKNVPL